VLNIFEYAAAVTTFLSLASFLGAAYVSVQSKQKEKSIAETIKGEGIDDAESVVKVLKQFRTEEGRLTALEKIRGMSQDRAAGVLDKVKPEIDVGKFSLVSQVQTQRRLMTSGVVFVILALLALFYGWRSSAGSDTNSCWEMTNTNTSGEDHWVSNWELPDHSGTQDDVVTTNVRTKSAKPGGLGTTLIMRGKLTRTKTEASDKVTYRFHRDDSPPDWCTAEIALQQQRGAGTITCDSQKGQKDQNYDMPLTYPVQIVKGCKKELR